MGTNNCNGKEPLVILEKALQAGVTMFQLREKGPSALTGESYVTFAKQCQSLCWKYNVPFIINDDVELAFSLNADGIHVGQDDLSIEAFRQQCEDKIVGVSVHNLVEMETAIQNGANYVGIGSIFQTKSKGDASQSSLDFLRQVRTAYPDFPIVGIGGITVENSMLVRQYGADGVAVISEIAESDNIERTVKNL